MTSRDLTRLLIKVFGLLILLNTAISLPSTIYGFKFQMDMWVAAKVVYDLPSLTMAVTYHFGPVAIYTALGLSFIWWSSRIVDRAGLASQDNSQQVAPSDLKNIEVCLVAVVGLYFIAEGFAELCRFTFSQSLSYAVGGLATLKSIWTGLTGLQVSSLLQIVVRLTIGAGLVLGRGATVAMIHRTRYWVRKWRAWPYEPESDQAH